MRRDWSWSISDGIELRLMNLPGLQNLYLVLIDDDGMHQVARTQNDRAATKLAACLDAMTGSQP